MDYEKYLKKKYQADEIIEVNKDIYGINWIYSIQRIIVRFEKRTTLYGKKVTMLHEMAYNSDGKLVPKYFGPEIKKKNNNKNWVGCICFYALIITFTQEETNYPSYDKIPFIDRIKEPPIDNLDLNFELENENEEEISRYIVPVKRVQKSENKENNNKNNKNKISDEKSKSKSKSRSNHKRKKKKKINDT